MGRFDMEDDNRISITVCGDGGCGKYLFFSPASTWGFTIADGRVREIVDHVEVGEESVDT